MANGGKREGAGRKPGSQNKATSQIRALASEHAETAIQTLVDLMQSDETPAAARVSAAKELLERGFGRSGNYVSLNLDQPLSKLSPGEAMKTIGDSVAANELSVDDGQKLISLVEARTKAVELDQLKKQLEALEARL